MNTSALMSLLSSWFSKLIDFISGFFAFIPMTIYFLYAGVASLLDLFQYVIRKLAGLDVYYVNGQKQEGDILVSVVRGILGIDNGGAQYSTLSTVFWSLIIFSVVLLVLATIIQMIKAHYNYDAKKSQPYAIITASIKSLFTIVIVPIVTVFGLYISEVLLNVLDQLTSSSSGTNITTLFGNEANLLKPVGTTKNGDKIYASFDFFSFGAATTQTTFSGAMFKIAARDCNRVRLGTFSTKTSSNSAWQDFGIFIGDEENISMRIDEAFASNLHTVNYKSCGFGGSDSWVLSSSYLVGGGAAWGLGLIHQNNFSKYNVGMVYYYYNLWSFNFFLAFAGIAAFITLFINIVFGLMTRLIMCIALFLLYSPLVGISPLDGGNAFKSWKKEFMSNVLMAYGTVVGMNIFFLILPFLDTLTFFNIYVLDQIMRILFMLSGLVLVKKFMKLVGGFIGAADANEAGNDVKEGVQKIGMSSARGVMAAGKLGASVAGAGMKLNNKIYEASKKGVKGKSKLGKVAGGLGLALSAPAKGIQSVGNVIGKGLAKSGKFVSGHNGRVRKALGLNKDAEIGADEEAAFKEYSKIASLGNASKAELRKAYKDAGGGDAGIAAMQEANNTAAAARLKKAGVSDDDIEKMKEKGEGLIQDQNPQFKAVGKAFLDVGGATLKLAGDLSGISTTFKKNLEEAKVFDSARSAIQSFYQAIGQVQLSKSPFLQTKEQQEKEEKEAVKMQREHMEQSAKNSKRTMEAIDELIKVMKGK